jgi:hypothetical protein
MKGKKAMGVGDMGYWMVRILFVVLLLFSMYFVVQIYESKFLDTAETEAMIFKHYMIYNPNALPYRDPYSNRVYPGIVDVNNFNTARLDAAANFGKINNMIAAKIVLFNMSGVVVADAYYNEERYYDWEPLTIGKGIGAPILKAEDDYVLFAGKDGKIKPGVLTMNIIVPIT